MILHILSTVARLAVPGGARAVVVPVRKMLKNQEFAMHRFAPVSSVSVLLDASRAAAPSDTIPVVLADAGVENVNTQVDAREWAA